MKDFDAFLKELEDAGPTFKLFGDVYRLPASPSALSVLKLLALRRKPEEIADDQLVLEIFRSFFGAAKKADGSTGDFVTVWLEQGLTLSAMVALLQWVLAEYRLSGEGTAEGKGSTG